MTATRQPGRECRARHPGGIYLCTLPKGHSGGHKHAYSRPVINGFRRGTNWK